MGAVMLLDVLRQSTRDIIGDAKTVAVAYSGGLDSSLVAELSSEVAETKCYAATVPGSHDARTAATSASEDGRLIQVISLADADLVRFSRRAVAIGSKTPTAVAYTVPLMVVLENAKEDLVLAGNGADELFGGYSKYMTSADPEVQMRLDLEKSLGEASALAGYAAGLGKKIGFPFLSQSVQELAGSLPLDQKIRGGSRKVVLRDIAEQLGLPSCGRPKKAAQYSSGVMKGLERMAKADGLDMPSWLRSL